MPVATSNQFLESLRKSGLVEEAALDEALSKYTGTSEEPIKIAEYLIVSKLITSFQAKSLLGGRFKGLVIGAYRVMDKIGAGGMGIVYLGEHEKLKRRVAIKILPEDKTKDKLSLERFYREARAAAALDHPNIVKAFDVSEQNGMHYLVMEYIDGTNLQKYVDTKGPLPWKTAVNILIQSCKGLQHASERNMVHRDIKPANILVDKTGQVKILDLGLARSFEVVQDNLTQDLSDGKDVMGSIDYIAPEQAIANNTVDVRADIYSLGATFYTLVTGKPPVEGTTAQKLLQHQMQMPVPISRLRPEIPEGMNHVLAHMMAKRPEHRYRSPNEVIAALTPFLGNNSQNIPVISAGTQFDSMSLGQVTAGMYRPQTGNLQPTAPLQGSSGMVEPGKVGSGTVSSHSTKIESKGATFRVKQPAKLSLDSKLSPRTLLLVGAISAILIPAVTLYLVFTDGKVEKKVDPSANRQTIGDKYTVTARTAMPDLKITDMDNKLFKLSDYRGKVILVHFYGFGDPKCHPALETQKALLEKYTNRPFEILGINTDTDGDILDFGMKKFKLPWRNAKNLQADGSAISQSIGAKILPTWYLIDSTGNVRHIWEGSHTEAELAEDIELLIKPAEVAIESARLANQQAATPPPAPSAPAKTPPGK
ncbi:MAG TPA: protein kinase [Gemmatales bacterium]|nr:protein kinase [Gemmatales bacterium]